MIAGFSIFKYKEKLAILALTTLETRRRRRLKFSRSLENTNSDIFLTKSQSSLRGHSLKLAKQVLEWTLINILLATGLSISGVY